MAAGETKAEWYTSSINPNGRMPAIVHVKEDDTSVTVFESGPCLLYMANEFDKEHKLSYPFGTPEYWTQLSWVSQQALLPPNSVEYPVDIDRPRHCSFRGSSPATAL